MLALNDLLKIVKKRKRVGRGGSRGGTSGKGHKGQKARSGPTLGIIFEGGQMPLTRRLPKRGFNNANFNTKYLVINLADLERCFQDGQVVDNQVMRDNGLIKGKKFLPVKILGEGKLSKKLVVHAHAFSDSAAQVIKGLGGEAHIVS